MLKFKIVLVFIFTFAAINQKLKSETYEPIEISLNANLNKESRVLILEYHIKNQGLEPIFIPLSDWHIDGFNGHPSVYSSQYYYVNRIHNSCAGMMVDVDATLTYKAKYIPKILEVAPYTTLDLKITVNKVDTVNLCAKKLVSDLAYTDEATMESLENLFYKIDFIRNVIVTPDYQTNIYELNFDGYDRCMMYTGYSKIKMDDTLDKCLKIAFLKKLKFAGELKIK